MVETLEKELDYFERLENQGITTVWERKNFINKESLTQYEYSDIMCHMEIFVDRYKCGLFFPDKDKPWMGRNESSIHSFRVRAEIDYSYKHYPKEIKVDCFVNTIVYTDRIKTRTEEYISYRCLFSRYFVQVPRKRLKNRYMMVKTTAKSIFDK